MTICGWGKFSVNDLESSHILFWILPFIYFLFLTPHTFTESGGQTNFARFARECIRPYISNFHPAGCNHQIFVEWLLDGSSIDYLTRISIQSIWIADYACILKNKRRNVVDSIWWAIHILWIDLFLITWCIIYCFLLLENSSLQYCVTIQLFTAGCKHQIFIKLLFITLFFYLNNLKEYKLLWLCRLP